MLKKRAAVLYIIDQTQVWNRGFHTRETENENREGHRASLFSSVWSPMTKHDKRVFDLASQSSIHIAMNI